MTNRIWIVLTIIVVVAGYGLSHKVERVVAPVNIAGVFR